MARVYISSSFKDLIEARKAATEAVLSLEHQPVGMETYSAAPERPIERCLADVRSCQIYLGIVAFRYGEIAKGFNKSFTHLEYEQAVRSGLRILVFLLNENAPWPAIKFDVARQRIDKFRDELKRDHLAAHFNTDDELKYHIVQALKTADRDMSGTGAARPIPDLLPFLADVKAQEYQLHLALQQWKTAPRRPVLCIVSGDELQNHEMISRRFEEHTLRELLSMQPVDPAVTPYTVNWPSGSRDPNELRQRLDFEVSRAILGAPSSHDRILNQIAHVPGPVACKMFIFSEHFLQCRFSVIDEVLNFWNAFPDLERDQVFILFLFIKFQVRREFLGVFSRQSRRIEIWHGNAL
jgi:hypothetical protein